MTNSEMRLRQVKKLADIAIPEGDQRFLTKEEQKTFATLRAQVTERLTRESYQKTDAFKEYLTSQWDYIEKREMLMMKDWKDYSLSLSEAAKIWDEVYGN